MRINFAIVLDNLLSFSNFGLSEVVRIIVSENQQHMSGDIRERRLNTTVALWRRVCACGSVVRPSVCGWRT